MSETVERTSLDLRFQSYRLRNEAVEARLLASIAARDIEQPLAGVDTPQGRLLLDGFKRYRCAAKLGIECVPYVSLGGEEAMGIASLMRVAKQSTLSILEQARFVVELVTMHDMSNADVAEMLSRSKGWVSMRRRLLKEMSQRVQEVLFRGGFPVYSYMVTLRPVMRMNGVGQDEIEEIVVFTRLELYNRGVPCGPKAIRKRMDDDYSVRPLPSTSTIARILARRGLTHARTGWYPGDGPAPQNHKTNTMAQ